jgi:hypothetical protein
MPSTRASKPASFVRVSGLRTPKNGVHSAPAYVVGMETTGRPVCTETALVVSITLPPPSAMRPSAPSASASASRTPAIPACG